MRRRAKLEFLIATCVLLAFVLWTTAILFFDVREIGPRASAVGFATLNSFVHRLTGVHMSLYVITDWLGLVPVAVGFGFAILGLVQWIKRKNILKVDYSILVLGGFYIVVLAVYLIFEEFVINYRPILIDGFLEASYPSSTTMLVMCVMSTAVMQFNSLIKVKALRIMVALLIYTFICFMVIGRLISGVHWFTDIIGGILLSVSLVDLYSLVCGLK